MDPILNPLAPMDVSLAPMTIWGQWCQSWSHELPLAPIGDQLATIHYNGTNGSTRWRYYFYNHHSECMDHLVFQWRQWNQWWFIYDGTIVAIYWWHHCRHLYHCYHWCCHCICIINIIFWLAALSPMEFIAQLSALAPLSAFSPWNRHWLHCRLWHNWCHWNSIHSERWSWMEHRHQVIPLVPL